MASICRSVAECSADSQPGLRLAVAHQVVHVHEFDPIRGDRLADRDRIADRESLGVATLNESAPEGT